MATQTLISEIESFRHGVLMSSLEVEFANCSDEERKSNIGEIINELRTKNKILDMTSKNKKNEIFDEIDEMTLSQSWNKIPEKKRTQLLENYINELEPDDDKLRNHILVLLSNVTLTQKIVNYNTKKKKIESINNLIKTDEGKYMYDDNKNKKNTKEKNDTVTIKKKKK